MKKLIALIVFMFFLCLPVSSNAGACERYWDELVGQTFEATIGNVDYSVYFSDSAYGPCPGGIVTLSYIDVRIIDDVEYIAEIELEVGYTTSYDIVTVAGIDFILHAGKLIMLPDEPMIFDRIVEE